MRTKCHRIICSIDPLEGSEYGARFGIRKLRDSDIPLSKFTSSVEHAVHDIDATIPNVLIRKKSMRDTIQIEIDKRLYETSGIRRGCLIAEPHLAVKSSSTEKKTFETIGFVIHAVKD